MLDAAKAVVEDMKYTGVLEALMEGHPFAQKHGRPRRGRRRGPKSSMTSPAGSPRDGSPAGSRPGSSTGYWETRRDHAHEEIESDPDSRDASPTRVQINGIDKSSATQEVSSTASALWQISPHRCN